MTISELTCEVCDLENVIAKYKCPKCKTPYCSVDCCKKHKSDGCNLPKDDQEVVVPPAPAYQYPTDDTVPIRSLQLLRHNSRLRDILRNPHLRTIMEAINNSRNPSEIIHQAMLEPIFVEFADECLKTIEDQEFMTPD